MKKLKQFLFGLVVVLMVMQQCGAMRYVQKAKTKLGKNYKTGQKRFYSRTNFKNWFNRLKKPQLSKMQKAVGLTTTGVAAGATYTWWDKIKEFFGYKTKLLPVVIEPEDTYAIIEDIDYKGGEHIKEPFNVIHAIYRYEPENGIIPSYPGRVNVDELFEHKKLYNMSKAENGATFEFLMSDAKSESTNKYKKLWYVPATAILKNKNNQVIAQYVLKIYHSNNPEEIKGTVEIIGSSLVGDADWNNIPAHHVLLEYAEKRLKKSDIKSIKNETARVETDDLWEQWGYEGTYPKNLTGSK